MSSSQNERTMGREGGQKRTRANKRGGVSKLGNLVRKYFLNVLYPKFHKSKVKHEKYNFKSQLTMPFKVKNF